MQSQKRKESFFKIYRGVEQLVARRAHNPEVVGSSPAPATTAGQIVLVGFFYCPIKMFGNNRANIKSAQCEYIAWHNCHAELVSASPQNEQDSDLHRNDNYALSC